MSSVANLSEVISRVFGPLADEAAQASGFVRRRSKLGGARFVGALVLGFLQEPGASLSRLCQVAAGLGTPLSPQALDQRLTPAGAACLRRVLEAAVGQALEAAAPVAIPLLRRFSAVLVQDSSVVALPDALEAEWPGCGERRGKAQAALKLHVRLDLLGGRQGHPRRRVAWGPRQEGPLLTDGRVHDAAGPLEDAAVPPGALLLRDLGFFCLAAFRALGAGGAFWLSRFKTGTAVLGPDGRRRALVPWLERGGAAVDEPIQLGLQERLPCRLLAVRVPPEVADQRRRKLRAAAQREGRAPGKERLALCAWTLLVTNCPPELLGLDEALALARARWQVELLFRRWKCSGGLERWRSAKPAAILCEVYAKLLGALLAHWAVLQLAWRFPDKSLAKMDAAVRRHVPLLVAGLAGLLPLGAALDFLARALEGPAGRIGSRARRRTFQLLLDPGGLLDVDLALAA